MVTAFGLQKGKTNLTSGSYSEVFLVHAVEDSVISITWDPNQSDSSSDQIEMTAGTDFRIKPGVNGATVTIQSGKVHIEG
jgi:hypothetical protein